MQGLGLFSVYTCGANLLTWVILVEYFCIFKYFLGANFSRKKMDHAAHTLTALFTLSSLSGFLVFGGQDNFWKVFLPL